MTARSVHRAYDSAAAFYQDVYGHAVREVRPAGRTGATMMTAEQDAGDWSDAPVPDLLVTMLVRHNPGATIDLGAGRFREATVVNRDFVVTPPLTPTTTLIDGPNTVRFVALPYPALLSLAGEGSGLPTDGDFGVLHAGMQRDRETAALLDRLWSEARTGSPHGALWADGALLQLAAGLLRLRNGRVQPARGGLAPWQLRRVNEYLAAHLADDVALGDLADVAGLSPTHFSRAFRQATGRSPVQELIARRMERARALLADSRLSVIEVAALCGYESPSAFAQVFRRRMGMTPTEWRRQL